MWFSNKSDTIQGPVTSYKHEFFDMWFRCRIGFVTRAALRTDLESVSVESRNYLFFHQVSKGQGKRACRRVVLGSGERPPNRTRGTTSYDLQRPKAIHQWVKTLQISSFFHTGSTRDPQRRWWFRARTAEPGPLGRSAHQKEPRKHRRRVRFFFCSEPERN